MDERGQAYSLEGVIGAIIIASALVLGMQAVSIEPWTSDGPEQGVETRIQLEDTLDILEDDDALRQGLLCLGGDRPETPHEGVVSTSPAVEPIGPVLRNTSSQTASYNIYVAYPSKSDPDEINETVIGSESSRTGSAVTVTREVVLYDSDPVYELNDDGDACIVDEQYDNVSEVPTDDIYVENQNPDGDIYAVVQIKVVAW